MQAKLAIAVSPHLHGPVLPLRNMDAPRRRFRPLALVSGLLAAYRAWQAKAVSRAMRSGLANIE